jgi:hypothetical protein
MHDWPPIGRAIWIATFLVEIALLLGVFRKKVFQRSPVFSIYIGGQVATSMARIWVAMWIRHGMGINYLHVPGVLDGAVSIAGLFAVAEICAHVVEPYAGARKSWRVWKGRIIRSFGACFAVFGISAMMNPYFTVRTNFLIFTYLWPYLAAAAGTALRVAVISICRRYLVQLSLAQGLLLLGFAANLALNLLEMLASYTRVPAEMLIWLQVRRLSFLAVLVIWHFVIADDQRLRQAQ